MFVNLLYSGRLLSNRTSENKICLNIDLRYLITDCRGRIGEDVIEAIECMKSRWKACLISEKPLLEVATMLGDFEERAQRLGQGSGMGSGCSEPGSDISEHIG